MASTEAQQESPDDRVAQGGNSLSFQSEMELQRLRGAFDTSPEAIFIIDPAAMTLVDANEEACRTLGYTREALLETALDRVFPGLRHKTLSLELNARRGFCEETPTLEMLHRCHDGLEFPVRWHIRATETDGGPLLIVFACRLMPQTQTAWEQQLGPLLLTDLGHDPLTRLPNRRLFERRLQWTMKAALRRRNYTFAVLFVDLDGFKAVNDRLGHQQGDLLLMEIGRRLSRCVRPGDLVARIGGDEFTVLVENFRNRDDAMHVAERIQASMASPIPLEDESVTITASIGIAHSSRDYIRPETILRDADRAMYRAKVLGKSNYVFHKKPRVFHK